MKWNTKLTELFVFRQIQLDSQIGNFFSSLSGIDYVDFSFGFLFKKKRPIVLMRQKHVPILQF